ncbi:MAG TPA: type II toxin-antitoxin system VapC family toxin [Chloroflexota bacterium]|nr:type II toxin-antitoxin system VapC family toxin [Chloroflexota bacterium]
MTIVTDTSILIEHLRGNPRAHAAVAGAFRDGHRVVASVLSRLEVLAGMRDSEEPDTWRLLGLFEWISVNPVLADAAGEMARKYLRSHPGVDPVDFVIAATTQELGAELWTRNLKHFPMLSASARDPLV